MRFLSLACFSTHGILCSGFFPFLIGAAIADNWVSWRGPTGDGVSTEKDLPTKWSASDNVEWKTRLPDRGNSTPVIWGDRVFVTQAIEKEGRRLLLCFDRTSGQQLWQAGTTYSEKELTHDTNPPCSSSPVTDGERVIAWFGSAGLFAFDFAGKELWKRDLGLQRHIWGYGSSPVIHGDACYLNFGPGERSFLIAVDKRTGATLWEHQEPGGHSGEPVPGSQERAPWIGAWGDPLVRNVNGRVELIMTFPGRVCAFDPAKGKELWTCGGLNPLIYTSPLCSDGIVVAMGGYGGSALAVRAGGSGDITSTHRLWLTPRSKQRIGSGAIHEGHIYILNDPGIAECFELQTGKLVWDERLRGPGPTGQNWSSLVLANGLLYTINHSGDAFVFRASPKFELLSTNSLGERTIASMAVSDGEIFIRTYQHLWCIAARR